MKNIIKMAGLLVIVCTTNLFAMRMTSRQIAAGQRAYATEQQRLGKIFIQEEDTNKGFWIELPELQSKSAIMVRDKDGVALKDISVPFSIDVVKLVLGIPDASAVPLNQFKKVIGCIKFFKIQYKEDNEKLEPSKTKLYPY